jgi:hypothetical protein
MGLFDKAKRLAEKAGPLIDKAAPHARSAVGKAGEQIDKRTGGKYHDKIDQVGDRVGEYADKRMAASGTAPADATAADASTPVDIPAADITSAEVPGTTAEADPAGTDAGADPWAGPDDTTGRPTP